MNPQTVHDRLQSDFPYFARHCLKIKTKSGSVDPFIFNAAQQYLHEQISKQLNEIGKVRIIIVKGRQQGCSTYMAGRFYHRATRKKGQSIFILSHESETTKKLFRIVERFHEEAPTVARPQTEIANKKELVFKELSSDYSVGTAGNENVGRGGTVQCFHGSEVAFWENTDQIQTGILQSIPDLPGTEVVLESTANGMANFFYDLTVEAEAKQNDYRVVFIPWFWQPEYRRDHPADGNRTLTAEEEEYKKLYSKDPYKKVPLDDEQIYWMRAKISEFKSTWKFYQEYPAYLQQAFQTSGETLILPQSVIRARKSGVKDQQAPLIIGVDPGRTKDRSVFVYRRGRQITHYEIFRFKKEERIHVQMVLAGMLAQRIEKFEPDAIFVDTGEGNGVVDRLHELGYSRIVRAVHFGESPIDEVTYLNKRAEMWCMLRDWFHGEDGEVGCPDTDEFQRDVCAMPKDKLTSSSKIQLVSSEIIRQQVKMSLDIGSAAALTFAYPVRSKYAEGHGFQSIKNKRGGVSELKTLRTARRQDTMAARKTISRR